MTAPHGVSSAAPTTPALTEPVAPTASAFSASRRNALKAGASLVVSFALPAATVGHAAVDTSALPPKTVALDEVAGFLAIDPKGNVTVYSGKVDLGTGVRTALAQMAAEELSVPMSRVTLIEGDTALTPDQGPTFGSLSIQIGGMQIRQAAATAREALLGRAAARLGATRDALTVTDGVVHRRGAPAAGGVSYVTLLAERGVQMKVDPKAPVKDPADYTIVGRSLARVDIPDKVTANFLYMGDFRRPGMLHARVVFPAGMGAELQAVDDSPCKGIPGYAGMVRRGNFLAVLANEEWAAIRASRAIRAQWSDWRGLPDQSRLWEHVRNTKVVSREPFQTAGDAVGALQQPGLRTLSASYDFAIHTHGSLGPSCAVAEMRDGQMTVWTASQQTHLLRTQIATMLQVPPASVRCVYLEGAGCYGRNGHEDAAADAALLARETKRPVRVQWMREDEHRWDPKGPPTLLDYRGSIGAEGMPFAWHSEVYIPNRPKQIAVTLTTAEFAGLPREDAHPGNIHQSLAIPYGVPNVLCSAAWLANTPFRPSWIRTPGRMQNTFGNESFLDEMAFAAGIDPIAYRERLLAADPRGLHVLERLRKLAAWQPRVSSAWSEQRTRGDLARGRGVSYIRYELVRTYVGVVADVTVNRRTGAVKVDRFCVAHDCGQIINPDGLRNQIDGNVISTVSRTLLEELTFDRSTVTSVDWASYRTIRFPDVPQIDIDLIDRPNERPWGAGEPTAAVVPSAIANAIFDATGVRLRSVPFTPEKVLAGLRAARA